MSFRSACWCLAALVLAMVPAGAQSEGDESAGCDNNGAILIQGAQNSYSCTTDSGAGCDNNGAILVAGVQNTYACHAQDPCTNRGVIVIAGPGNRYDCEGPCANTGLVVNALGDYCGSGTVFICLGRQCVEYDGVAANPALAAPAPPAAP